MASCLSPSHLSDATWRLLVNVLGGRWFGSGSGSDVVDWAVDALMAGWESTALKVLAGLAKPANDFEVDRYVERLLEELDVEMPDPRHLANLYANAIARDMLAGNTTPYDGAKQLYLLWRATGCPSELQPWCGLEDEYELARDHVYGDVADAERHILDQARSLVGPG